MATNNRVWIELEVEKPSSGGGFYDPNPTNKDRAEKATRMLKRLGASSEIFWYPEKGRYCVADSSGTYVEMADRGHWFNLDYFGRED